MNETIVIILVEAIFLVIIAFILYVTTKKINLLLKKIFVGNLKEFDYLVEEREKKTTELNEEIYKKSVELKRCSLCLLLAWTRTMKKHIKAIPGGELL